MNICTKQCEVLRNTISKVFFVHFEQQCFFSPRKARSRRRGRTLTGRHERLCPERRGWCLFFCSVQTVDFPVQAATTQRAKASWRPHDEIHIHIRRDAYSYTPHGNAHLLVWIVVVRRACFLLLPLRPSIDRSLQCKQAVATKRSVWRFRHG